MLRRFRKKQGVFVVAVQLNLETDGFPYQKWGGIQRCKAGDWIVNNCGEVYTIDQEVFSKTYREVRTGLYEKVTVVWARIATDAGSIETREGITNFLVGDYVVYNEPTLRDGYAVRKTKFEEMYEEILE